MPRRAPLLRSGPNSDRCVSVPGFGLCDENRPSGLRVRSLLLVLLTMVPALGLFVSTAVERRGFAGAAARQEVSQIARLAATRHDILVDDARDLLHTL